MTTEHVTARRPRTRGTSEKPELRGLKAPLSHNGFQEPPLATPVAGATGQPLEELPNLVSKRELGALPRKRAYNKKEQEERVASDKRLRLEQSHYEAGLATQASEPITHASEIRTALKTKQEPLDPDTDRPPVILSIRRRSIVKASPKKSKNTSFAQGVVDPTDSEREATPAGDKDEEKDVNQDFCSACGQPGSFICCEGCPKSFHFRCLNPPLDPQNLPDTWYCPECLGKRYRENHPNQKHLRNVGIFARLLDDLEFACPAAFRLPKEISEAYEGVAMDRIGDYLDDSMKPVRTYRQLVKEKEDPLNGIYDSEGNPIFCHKCGGSGLNHKEIIQCDYCPLGWHLDCLDPPLASVKRLGTKWRCPNHADNEVTPRLKLRDQSAVDVSTSRGVKLPADANIEIINVDNDDLDVRYVYDERGAEMLLADNPIYNYQNKSNGLGYSYTEAMQRYLNDSKLGNVTYRLREEGIILDFIKGAKIRKVNERQTLDSDNMIAYGKVRPELRDYLWGLSQLSNRSIVSPQQRRTNFDRLLQLADDECKLDSGNLDKQELRELLIVKRLIELKGEDNLVKFLKQ